MSTCFIRCSCELAGFAHYLQGEEEVEFHLDLPRSGIVRLSRTDWDRQRPADLASAICTGEATYEGVDETLESLRGVIGELYTRAMVPTVAVFRWRWGLTEGPTNPFRNIKGYSSPDGKSWRELPLEGRFDLHLSYGMPFNPLSQSSVISDEIVELTKTKTEEPLGRQLFREAWNLKETSPRSALIIGVAAAEVGFKKLVGDLVPAVEWLMDEIPTPPLGKMLRKFLPELPVRVRFQGKAICPPKILLKQLDGASERRNKVVHVGQPPPNRNELEKMLRAVSDFLWICDLYSGHAWAREHISVETLTAWAMQS